MATWYITCVHIYFSHLVFITHKNDDCAMACINQWIYKAEYALCALYEERVITHRRIKWINAVFAISWRTYCLNSVYMLCVQYLTIIIAKTVLRVFCSSWRARWTNPKGPNTTLNKNKPPNPTPPHNPQSPTNDYIFHISMNL